jgi:hypothetical protein
VTLALTSRRAALAPGPWVRNELWRRARAVPSLDLRFAENKSLVDATTGAQLVTFTRASSGTFVGSDGVIRTAVTNLLLRSEEFDNASWTKTRSSITADSEIAPNGTLTADKVVEDTTASATHLVSVGSGMIAGNTYTYSVYAKPAGRDWIVLSPGSTWGFAWFNISSGTIGTVTSGGSSATAAIQPVGNGWYRCSVTSTAVDNRGLQILMATGNNAVTYTGDGTSGVFLWGAQLEQSSTVGEYIPTTSTINSAPRFDHNPTTGESLGLLVEEQRTNSIRNNTMVGAVAGTPGTVPTNWAIGGAAGLTSTVVGVGTLNGISYIDLQLVGTSSGTFTTILFEPATQVAATNAQAWAISSYVSIVAGSVAGSSVSLTLNQINSGGSLLAQLVGADIASSLNSSLARFSFASTTNQATIAFVRPLVSLNYSSGVAIDITLRIGLPQLEQGAFATSMIPTSTVAVTRSADVASISGSNFSAWYRQDEGTVFADTTSVGSNVGFTFVVSDGTDSNRIGQFKDGSNVANRLVLAGVQNNAGSIGYSSPQLRVRSLVSAQAGNTIMCVNGTLGTASTQSPLPTVDRITIGSGALVSNFLGGTIRRLTYWPTRLPNSTLQAVTQ